MLRSVEGTGTERQFRLVMCAALERIWPAIKDVRSREAVEVVRRFADRRATKEQLEEASRKAFAAYRNSSASGMDAAAGNAAYCVTYSRSDRGVSVAHAVFADIKGVCRRDKRFSAAAEVAVHCRLFRCVFGDPFLPRRGADRSLLEWNNGVVRQMAKVIYREQRWPDLPVLADALEEAGCDEAGMLEHCRDGGLHVRGCWAVDGLLGKK
jgi:hypothetical protein